MINGGIRQRSFFLTSMENLLFGKQEVMPLIKIITRMETV